jgi:hypothetical protein
MPIKHKPKEHPKFKCTISGSLMTISWDGGWLTLFQDEAIELMDSINKALPKMPTK